MFRVKVCGVRRVEDALVASDAGADALGINFYAKSPRSATLDEALAIADAVGQRARLVGVFVNESPEEVARLAEAASLSAVQLHGDEPPEALRDFPLGDSAASLGLIKAMRIGPDGLAPLFDYLERCEALGRMPDGLLLDAASTRGYGGTGESIDWSLGSRVREHIGDLPWALAGGLNAANVRRAIALAKPDGVDTASGVETSPGVKHHASVQRFVAEALAGISEAS